MRRATKVGYQVRDFVHFRLAEIRLGGLPNPFLDLGRLRVLLASLVGIGVVEEDDWRLPLVPLASRGGHIDAMAAGVTAVIEARILSRGLGLVSVDQRVLLSFSGVIADLVVEMALITQSRERVLTSLVVVSHKRVRPNDRKPFDPGDVVGKSALHSDPEGFVRDALDRLRVARDDVAAGKRRIAYLAAKAKANPCGGGLNDADVRVDRSRASTTRLPIGEEVVGLERDVPSAIAIDTPHSLALVSAIRGVTDDLLRPIEPVVRPSPDPARRRR